MEFECIAVHLPASGFSDGQPPSPWLCVVSYFAAEGAPNSGSAQNADHRYEPAIAEKDDLRSLGPGRG